MKAKLNVQVINNKNLLFKNVLVITKFIKVTMNNITAYFPNRIIQRGTPKIKWNIYRFFYLEFEFEFALTKYDRNKKIGAPININGRKSKKYLS